MACQATFSSGESFPSELATGTGDLALAVREACPTARVTAMDFAFPMMQLAREKLRVNGVNGACYAVVWNWFCTGLNERLVCFRQS